MRPLRDKLRITQKASERDYDRLYSDYSPRLLLRGLEARRRKIRYKTRQYARERAGEVFPSTLVRMRRGPPAHVLTKITPEERGTERVLRNPSEAGYTAVVKMKMGRKLKDGETWKMENGKKEGQERLEMVEEELRKGSMRRRMASVEGEIRVGVDAVERYVIHAGTMVTMLNHLVS